MKKRSRARYALSRTLAVLIALVCSTGAVAFAAGGNDPTVVKCGFGTSPSNPLCKPFAVMEAALDEATAPVAIILPGELDKHPCPCPGHVTDAPVDFAFLLEQAPSVAGLDDATVNKSAELTPGEPVTTPNWILKSMPLIIAALAMIRAAKPKIFEKDGVGFLLSLGAAFLYSFAVDAKTGGLTWDTAKGAFMLALAASGGYTFVWKRGLKPLLVKGALAVGMPSVAAFIDEGFGTSPSKPAP